MSSRFAGLAAATGLGAAAVLAGAGMLGHAVCTRRDRRRYPPPGDRVDIGGRRLHARRMGRGRAGPTVVFEAGLGCPLETWGWVQRAVSAVAPTVAYDRAGLGASDPAGGPRTAAAASADLERLLVAGAPPAPYLLVGHSFGGLLVRHFAATHPDLVAGMVLVDAAHPEQLQRSPRQWLGLPPLRAHLQGALVGSLLGTVRLTGRHLAAEGIGELPVPDRNTARARMVSLRANRTAYAELTGWLAHVNREVRDCRLGPRTPLAVLTAGAVAGADPIHHALQAELAQLSSVGTHRVCEGAGHLDIVTGQWHAAAVAEAVTAVWSAASLGRAARASGASHATPPIHR